VLPDVFVAVSNPARRVILDELCHGPRTAGELTGLLDLSRSAASEHLAVLREAGLVREERRGRHRVYHLQPAGLAEIGGWVQHFERYWTERLDALADLLDEENPTMAENTIRLERRIPHPSAAVWAALTTPELLSRWWAPSDVAPTVGHRFTMDMGAWGQQQCEVLAVEPGTLFSFLFSEGQLDTTVTWRLDAVEGGTVLHLEHTGFRLNTPMGRQAFEGMGNGWPGLLSRIEGVLAGPS
jgi:uncharacterized protein YndB with AHSA1/START domain